jgi:hypothetical protein
MLNNGLGFSDEFELEACNYSEKSSSKLKQQYKEWTYTMRKEGSAFLKTVKSKVKETWALFCLLSLLLCCLYEYFHVHCLFLCLLECKKHILCECFA